jgi:hypothetical protein
MVLLAVVQRARLLFVGSVAGVVWCAWRGLIRSGGEHGGPEGEPGIGAGPVGG